MSEDMLFAPPKKKALVSAFGGKVRLAPRIVAELGPHRAYWEPFMGGCAILFCKPGAGMETVIDLHSEMANLARVVQSDDLAPLLFDRMGRTLFCAALYEECRARVLARESEPAPERPDWERAYDWLVTTSMGSQGWHLTRQYNMHFTQRYTAAGGSNASRFLAAHRSIPRWWRRLRGVAVLQADAFGVLPRIGDEPGTVIYCDPPYIVKGADYIHDLTVLGDAETDRSQRRLARLVGRFERTRVVMSYYDHPLLREWYDGWTFVVATQSKGLANQGRRGKSGTVESPEVLLVNGPAYTETEPAGGWRLTEAGREAWGGAAPGGAA